MAIVIVPNTSLQPRVIVLIIITTLVSQDFVSDWVQIPNQAQIQDVQLQIFNVTVKAVTISDDYIWGVDDRLHDGFPPGKLM